MGDHDGHNSKLVQSVYSEHAIAFSSALVFLTLIGNALNLAVRTECCLLDSNLGIWLHACLLRCFQTRVTLLLCKIVTCRCYCAGSIASDSDALFIESFFA